MRLRPAGPPSTGHLQTRMGGEGPEGELLPGIVSAAILVPESPSLSATPFQRGSWRSGGLGLLGYRAHSAIDWFYDPGQVTLPLSLSGLISKMGIATVSHRGS